MQVKKFQQIIWGWYRKNGRHGLPWRRTRDPYKILVSEIMLQQTQVGRVIPQYKNFIKKFPRVVSLKRASTGTVLREWQGLGYNRRALYLKKSAERIARGFPRDLEALESLPGVGEYTARAIRVFAWGKKEIFIETNIRRVFLHFFFKGKRGVSDAEIARLVARTLPQKNIREWYWALMDYGADGLRDVSNPNRASAGYARQSRFLGSRRFARARVLSYILKKPRDASALRAFRKQNHELAAYSLTKILCDLADEGFIEKTRGLWRARR